MGKFENIDTMLSHALQTIEQANDSAAIENARITVLGKNGTFTQLGKILGSLPVEQKKDFGAELNIAKKQIEDKKQNVDENITDTKNQEEKKINESNNEDYEYNDATYVCSILLWICNRYWYILDSFFCIYGFISTYNKCQT